MANFIHRNEFYLGLYLLDLRVVVVEALFVLVLITGCGEAVRRGGIRGGVPDGVEPLILNCKLLAVSQVNQHVRELFKVSFHLLDTTDGCVRTDGTFFAH